MQKDYYVIYSLTVIALFIKMFIIAGLQGYYRIKNKAFVNPEDASFFGNNSNPLKEDILEVQLATKTLRNDLENIPIFLFIALCYINMECSLKGAYIYFTTFVFSRIMHSIFYIKPRQPLRNRMYILGILIDFILCGHILYSIFEYLNK